MPIRAFQPGDEVAQARIYNLAAGTLPAFKPATAEEIARRHASALADAGTRYYAVEVGETVGYAAFSPNGRISYPWCLPGAEAARESLLEVILDAMKERGIAEAWAAYRADWTPVLDFLRGHGFGDKRQMINYVAEVEQLLPDTALPPDRVIEPVGPEAIRDLRPIVPDDDVQATERFYSDNPYYDFSGQLVALKDAGTGTILGIALLVVDDRFADPTQINAAMPCFRFGTLGTERERHKRVNGLFSTVFTDEIDGEHLLGWLVRTRARPAGLTHIAAQAASDEPAVVALYDRFLGRQGAFPILSRPLSC